jgi:MFS family permease
LREQGTLRHLPARRELSGSLGLIWRLGLGAFGLAFSLTITAAYLPPLLAKFTESKTLISLVLGAEGVFALTLPVVIGPWSDTFYTPLGRRRPFMLVAVGPMAFSLALMPFMPSFWTMALFAFAFFFAYYVYEPPYRGLYPDLLEPFAYARSQGVQHILRGIAIGTGLVGGGALFRLWEPSPFLLAAFVMTIACGACIVLVREDGGHGRVFEGVGTYVRHSWRIFAGEHRVRRFLFANAAWEGTFSAARTFVVLYLLDGLHAPRSIVSIVLGAVAVGYVVAAIIAPRLGDRFGFANVIVVGSVIYGGALLLGGLATTWHGWYVAVIAPVSIAAGTVMTLAWGLLFKLMPPEHRGAISGLATTTKGIGLLAGPILAGAAIDLAAPFLQATDGYQILWPVLAVPILAAIPLVASLRHDERDVRVEAQLP